MDISQQQIKKYKKFIFLEILVIITCSIGIGIDLGGTFIIIVNDLDTINPMFKFSYYSMNIVFILLSIQSIFIHIKKINEMSIEKDQK